MSVALHTDTEEAGHPFFPARSGPVPAFFQEQLQRLAIRQSLGQILVKINAGLWGELGRPRGTAAPVALLSQRCNHWLVWLLLPLFLWGKYDTFQTG